MDDRQNYMDTPENKLRQIKRRRFWLVVRRGIVLPIVLILVAAIILGITLIPFVWVYGSSMEPTLSDGDLYIAWPQESYVSGDIIAFSREGKVLTRRIIALPGSWVDIDENGNVTVDGAALEESYLTETALGQCNVPLPYQVPDGQYFVLGDNRAEAVDSRSSVLGCVNESEIIGTLWLKLWPWREE